MHSKIFQISSKPISKKDYTDPSTYDDNSSDFADYIGVEVADDEREQYIGYLADNLKDIFTPVGRGVLAYKGEDAMRKFKQEWADAIKQQAEELTADNILCNYRLYRISNAIDATHIGTNYRVDIEDWCGGRADPFAELIEWAAYQLKEGDRIYIGAIIDYHY